MTSYVQIDVESGVRQALARIVSLGHTRLGYIRSDQSADRMPLLTANAGLTLDPDLVIQAGVTQQQGYDAAITLLDRPSSRRPTVILTRTDILAAGAVQAAQSLGLDIPGDVSIVGHDDIDLASLLTPPLTTVGINIPNVARAAMELLTALIADRTQPIIRVLETQLIFRSSLGPAHSYTAATPAA